MMDTQTIMALAIVFAAAVVLAYRFVVATKRTLSEDGCGTSGRGACSGCPSRGNSISDRSEHELVLVTLQKSPK
ncbi:MAG: FeoB-associated Cys-rich membrane protein [Pirellula sp.]